MTIITHCFPLRRRITATSITYIIVTCRNTVIAFFDTRLKEFPFGTPRTGARRNASSLPNEAMVSCYGVVKLYYFVFTSFLICFFYENFTASVIRRKNTKNQMRRYIRFSQITSSNHENCHYHMRVIHSYKISRGSIIKSINHEQGYSIKHDSQIYHAF